MTDWLRARTRATPQKLAVLFEGQAVTYAQLDRLTDALTAGLQAQGVQPGQRVAMHLPSSLEAVALIHAVARVGGVLVPLNTRLTGAELDGQLALTEPALLVTDEGPTDSWRGKSVPLSVLTRDATAPTGFRPGSVDSPQAIIFTSGTTGTPKGVVLTFANHLWSANASAYRLGLHTNDRWLSCLPLYHVGGLAVVFRSCLYGTAIVLQRRFELEEFQRSLRTDAVTLTSLVPTLLHRLLNSPATLWPDSLRLVLLGGAAASPELLSQAQAAGVPVATTYGLTEAASQVATALPADVARKPGSVGRPLLFTDVRMADGGSGEELPAGEMGDVLVRGPQVMAEYFRNPEATRAALQAGWLRTGDVGYLDEDGALFIVQRRRDIIITGGENVYPAEVEAALGSHPAVAAACVVGLADPEWGQRVAAAVALRPGAQVDESALLAHSRGLLAGYKQPRVVRFVEALPQTASGKIARQAVADWLAQESGR